MSVPSQRDSGGARSRATDGPFTESKEMPLGYSPGAASPPHGSYADVNGLRMYFESQGQPRDRPLVLLHAGFTTIESSFGRVKHALGLGCRVIAIEQQAHGRTADIDRRLSYEQMADDTAALMEQLEIAQADFFGFSMGASTASNGTLDSRSQSEANICFESCARRRTWRGSSI